MDYQELRCEGGEIGLYRYKGVHEINVSVNCPEVMFVNGSVCEVHRVPPYVLVMYPHIRSHHRCH